MEYFLRSHKLMLISIFIYNTGFYTKHITPPI